MRSPGADVTEEQRRGSHGRELAHCALRKRQLRCNLHPVQVTGMWDERLPEHTPHFRWAGRRERQFRSGPPPLAKSKQQGSIEAAAHPWPPAKLLLSWICGGEGAAMMASGRWKPAERAHARGLRQTP